MNAHITPPTPHIVSPSRGQIGAIAAGAYTEIVSITAPASASPGDLVTVEVKVRKLYWDWLPILVGGWLDSEVTAIWFSPEYKWFEPGDTQPFPFTYSFIMPNNAVDIYVWSYYGPNGDWIDDDSGYVNIALTAEVVPCEITITAPNSAAEGEKVSVSALLKNVSSYGYMYKTEIYAAPDLFPSFRIGTIEKYINSGSTFTAYGSFTMPASNTTILIWVERWAVDHWIYDSSASKVVSLKIPVPETFHLSVFVPSWAYGGYVQPGSGDYPAYSTVKLTAYPLSGYQFLSWGRDASGTSTTYNLYMNSDKNVEAYFEKVPVPIEGTIIRKELEYSGSGDGIVPVADVPLGVRAKLHVWGRNDMSISQGMGIYWFVADPEGFVAEEYTDWGGTIGPYPTDHEFISSGQFDLNKVGKYTFWIELLMGAQDDPEMVDLDIGELCTVKAAVPESEFRGFGVTEYAKR